MNKKHKVTTVDIVIPAFNEERCIENLLRDVSGSWQPSTFQVQNIYVISDASTDRTEAIVKRIAADEQRIKMVIKPKRKGKQDSINLALSVVNTDIVIFLDADVRLENKRSIANLIKHFRNEKVALVQGDMVRVRPYFTLNPAKLAAYFDWVIVDKLRNRKCISWWSIDGRVMAMSRGFYQNLVLPHSLADDQFIFYSCIRDGHKFIWANGATFYYGPPESISDFSHQWSRYFFYTKKSEEYFGKRLIHKDMAALGLWRTIISCLLHHPICRLIWLLCYCISKVEYMLRVDFGRYSLGFFHTKSGSLGIPRKGH